MKNAADEEEDLGSIFALPDYKLLKVVKAGSVRDWLKRS